MQERQYYVPLCDNYYFAAIKRTHIYEMENFLELSTSKSKTQLRRIIFNS